jgi:ParB/RepB/Spo0J family partition protein
MNPDNYCAPLSEFAPSRTNRRHDQAYITELAASIAAHGVLQPIIVRPWPHLTRGKEPAGVRYEIVAGEARWLASQQAGKTEIPYLLHQLDDVQALELQLVENLKRKDLTVFEEAEGYGRLMKEYELSADAIAERIGKSKATVYARLKLLDLCSPALRIVQEKGLDASTALLVARIPSADLQVKAAKEITTQGWGDDGPLMTYRSAHRHIQHHYMLELKKAPFPRADAELLPAAGSCADCQKRTGNAQDLFADIDSADICIDPTCHEAKVAAHVKRQKAAAKEAGLKVIDGAEAKKIIPNSYSQNLNGGLMDLDQEIMVGGKYQTVRKALGKDAPQAEAVIVDPHHKGKLVQAVSTATVKEKLAAKGIDVSIGRGSKSTAEKEAEKKRKQEATVRQRIFDQVRSRLTVTYAEGSVHTDLIIEEYRIVAETMYGLLDFESRKKISRLWLGPTDEKPDDHALAHELGQRIPNMQRGDICRLLLDCALIGDVSIPSYADRKPEKLLAMAASLEIDTAAIKKNVIAEAREKAAPRKKVQPKTAKTATDPIPAAQAPDHGSTKPAAQAETKAKPEPKSKNDPAPALPANEPPAAAKPSKPELADGLIYCHPDNPDLTWTGKGREPQWVKDAYKRGIGLDVRETSKPEAVSWPWPFPTENETTEAAA